jgi:hypothetical protein
MSVQAPGGAANPTLSPSPIGAEGAGSERAEIEVKP